MPEGPSALYVYTADSKDVDHTTGKVKNGYMRYVIYIPFATAATTGLPTKPSAPGMPWIMDPGNLQSACYDRSVTTAKTHRARNVTNDFKSKE